MDLSSVDLASAIVALATAVARRPWQAIDEAGPPWSWVLASTLMPLWWSLDRQLGIAITGAIVTLLVAQRPDALASYSDRYLAK